MESIKTNYPPPEIYDDKLTHDIDFEYLILWMLSNNESCTWKDFTEKPVSISQSTFSYYKNLLESKHHIENFKRGYYRITTEGRRRYHYLSQNREEEEILNYPPKIIVNKRNYEDIILWMIYNNNHCKWSDFNQEGNPVFINNSSLSKSLKALLEAEFIRKDNKKYVITQRGKIEYSRMLQNYDLDRQSILDEESKRVEELTNKTKLFFNKYNITDKDVKFRFISNLLKMSYSKVQNSIDNEEDFHKILLYFAINHPDSYPNYISSDEFSKTYKIEKIILDFHILQIVEKQIFPIKFFTLNLDDGRTYYFQADERIEKELKIIVDDHITKYTYHRKLDDYSVFDSSYLISDILDDICGRVFHEEIEDEVRKFLTNTYIKYLTYKIETKKQLIDVTDKLEGYSYYTISEMFQDSNLIESHCKEERISKSYLYPGTLKVLST